MSTRCEIKIEGVEYAKVYKHWDGYPEATLKWLEEFNREFTESRGDDTYYKFAQLLRSSIFMGEKFNLDQSKDTGWGVIPYNQSMGTEYCYILKTDGSVEVVEKSFNED